MVTEMNDESANEALLRPVRSGNVFEETVNRLLQLVWLGVYEPGDALPPERELASKLGVGRHRPDVFRRHGAEAPLDGVETCVDASGHC
jgi:hypothetical protein